MQGQDRNEATLASQQPREPTDNILETQTPAGQAAFQSTVSPAIHEESSTAREVDWLALGVVLVIAGLFALVGRISPHPATSLVPVAVLSATGCGLLVTALRKLRTYQHPGLFEAASGGVFLALFQFVVVISYPNVMYALSQAADQRAGFLSVWGLIGILSVLFSIIGAALGHLAFAPLRPLAANRLPTPTPTQLEPASEQESAEEIAAADVQASMLKQSDDAEDAQEHEALEGEETQKGHEDEESLGTASAPAVLQRRSFISYVIAVVLLGLAPTLVGYVFAATYDYLLQANLFFAGPYPTLRLLSTLLPWQIPLPFTLAGNDPNAFIFLLWQFWRIPLFLGNPTMFDFQALEPYVFNAAALAILLFTSRNALNDHFSLSPALRWSKVFVLESGLGLLLALPADLLIARGMHGLLQNQILAVPIRTLYILNPLTFTLNLISGALVCAGIGALLYAWLKSRQHANQFSTHG